MTLYANQATLTGDPTHRLGTAADTKDQHGFTPRAEAPSRPRAWCPPWVTPSLPPGPGPPLGGGGGLLSWNTDCQALNTLVVEEEEHSSLCLLAWFGSVSDAENVFQSSDAV